MDLLFYIPRNKSATISETELWADTLNFSSTAYYKLNKIAIRVYPYEICHSLLTVKDRHSAHAGGLLKIF